MDPTSADVDHATHAGHCIVRHTVYTYFIILMLNIGKKMSCKIILLSKELCPQTKTGMSFFFTDYDYLPDVLLRQQVVHHHGGVVC